MSTSTSIRRTVRCVLLSSASAAAAVALPAQAQQEEGAISEVIVTGSRIPQPNLTSISPVTAISAEQVKIEGVTRVEDLINSLPQAFGDFGGNLSNGATGAATVNLRNLGSQRTLVLVNGRRLMPGDPTQNGAASPDLNQIPGALIERVEVLTGGASAVYGADAVAGVVNFIMNDNFEGVRVDTQYGFYNHRNDNGIGDIVEARGFETPDSTVNDGASKEFTFIAGINTPDGRGNATVYLGYRELEALRQDQRDFSACALGSGTTTFTCSGSSTSAPGRFIGGGFDATIGSDGELRSWTSADQYNFAPDNYYQRPDERKVGGLFAHYDFSEAASLYTEFQFMDDRTLAQIAPSGAFLGGGPSQPPYYGDQAINCDNPYLAQSMVDNWCGGVRDSSITYVTIGRRNVEGGGRIDDLRHTSYRGVLGLKGDIASGWTYDVYALYGETLLAENYQNDFSRTRLGRALNAVSQDGAVVCGVNADDTSLNDDASCVPYNIFQLNSVTQDQLDYLQIPAVSQGSTTEQILSASLAGDLGQYGLKLPTATDGLGVAIGAEYRSERSELRVDQAYKTNDLAGQGAPTLDTIGSFDVKEIFAEGRLPILQDKAFAKVLSAEVGYRYSEYNLGFSTDSYKFGLDWAPADIVRLRGSYQRAVRSPNIQELYLQERVQLNGNTDPCAGETPSATFQECALTGVTAEQFGNILANPSEQYNGLVGGSPDLDPEIADTYTYGLVLTPEFLPSFTWTIDYFDIKVEKWINSVGQDFIISQCMVSGEARFCDAIHRIQAPGAVADGSIWLGDSGYVEDPIVNTGSLHTKGIDTEINYRLEIGPSGSIALNLAGTYTDSYVVKALPDFEAQYDCSGYFGTVCGTPVPEWRHKLRATWLSPLGVDLTLTWRYIAEVALDSSSDDVDLAGSVAGTDRRLGSRTYFDLVGSYSFQDLGAVNGLTARLGINNILDKDPPVVGQSNCPSVYCNGNTFPQVYDTLGRYVFLGLMADF